mgnify:CR=1 FL=1
MEERTLRILEFQRILKLLANEASSSLGMELAEKLRPTANPELVKEWQEQTAEALAILWREGEFPLGGISDVRETLKRAQLGASLEPAELLAVSDLARASRIMKKFLREKAKVLLPYAAQLAVFPELEAEIAKAIGPEGEVLDRASSKLAGLRVQIRTLQNRLRERLERMIHSEFSRYLQEPIVTIRQGRYVIPVKQEYKSHVTGLVHDQSASGQTLFIEPMAIVELNNQLRVATSEEEEEVARILAALSASVASQAEEFCYTLQALSELDLVAAKGRLAKKMRAEAPRLNVEGIIDLKAARHPFLPGDVVPIDVQLGAEHWTMVITGPNTGGKTVALKTVGLLALMAQSGLQIPAKEGSRLAIFDTIACDIGDEQSIQQSLSTFSAHMKNLVRIVRQAEDCSGKGFLALLDEVGAGTDPQEGAALAMSILSFLHRKAVRTIATTHYSELKSFAYLQPGMLNASVEFNAQTLEPTYRLLSGIPGSSCALTIAKRLGLPEALLQEAAGFLDPGKQEMGKLIQIIQQDKMEAQAKRDAAVQLEAEAAQLLESRQAQLRELEREKRKLDLETRQQAKQTLDAARIQTDQLIGQLRGLLKKLEQERSEDMAQTVEKNVTAVRDTLASLEEKMAPAAEAQPEVKAQGVWKAGMRAITPLGIEGQLLTNPDEKGMVQLGYGNMRINISVQELEPASGQPAESQASKPTLNVSSKAEELKTELDLRGETCEEAWEEVDKYLDTACLVGMKTIRIIHGKGTGALRRFLRNQLRNHPKVESIRPGGPGEGGDGVTVATMRS